eukprot:gb/GECH01004182.1/.p1 GENE.gb/GECH01004182.1/~~gb/GECH01004182.1/.p1  ORF type:complete len:655 (+),score=173.95 gb/GECH01004182.1/:1-1965(+)
MEVARRREGNRRQGTGRQTTRHATNFQLAGIEGRRTGFRAKANVLKDDDNLDNVSDFFDSDDESNDNKITSFSSDISGVPSAYDMSMLSVQQSQLSDRSRFSMPHKQTPPHEQQNINQFTYPTDLQQQDDAGIIPENNHIQNVQDDQHANDPSSATGPSYNAQPQEEAFEYPPEPQPVALQFSPAVDPFGSSPLNNQKDQGQIHSQPQIEKRGNNTHHRAVSSKRNRDSFSYEQPRQKRRRTSGRSSPYDADAPQASGVWSPDVVDGVKDFATPHVPKFPAAQELSSRRTSSNKRQNRRDSSKLDLDVTPISSRRPLHNISNLPSFHEEDYAFNPPASPPALDAGLDGIDEFEDAVESRKENVQANKNKKQRTGKKKNNRKTQRNRRSVINDSDSDDEVEETSHAQSPFRHIPIEAVDPEPEYTADVSSDDLDKTYVPNEDHHDYRRESYLPSGNSRVMNQRRSRRRKLPPLKFWENERPDYHAERKGDDTVVATLKGIKRPKTPQASKPNRKKPSTNNNPNKSEDIQAPIHLPDGSEQMMEIARPKNMMEENSAPIENGEARIKMGFQTPNWKSGLFHIDPRARKESSSSSKYTEVYYVLSGRVLVEINDTSGIRLQPGSFFFVPPNNSYSVENLSAVAEAKLVFFLSKSQIM